MIKLIIIGVLSIILGFAIGYSFIPKVDKSQATQTFTLTTQEVMSLPIELSNGNKTSVGQILDFTLKNVLSMCAKNPSSCTQ